MIALVCEYCGKTFYRYPSQSVGARFCSTSCKGKVDIQRTFSTESVEKRAKTRRGLNQPKEVRDKISRTLTGRCLLTPEQIRERTKHCLQCGRPFQVEPYRTKEGKGKVCSFRCRELYLWANPQYRDKQTLAIRRGQSIPTLPEKQLTGLLTKHFSQFKYNGDGSLGVMLGGLTPDFVNVNGKKQVIEVFGDYWHSPEIIGDDWRRSELGKVMIYNSVGWDCLVIWERELKELTEEEIVKKISDFSRRRLKCQV